MTRTSVVDSIGSEGGVAFKKRSESVQKIFSALHEVSAPSIQHSNTDLGHYQKRRYTETR